MTFEETKALIREGKHPTWNEAVKIYRSGKTPRMGIVDIRETGILVAIYQRGGTWATVVTPFASKEPLVTIANYIRETHGEPVGFALPKDGRGDVEINDPQDGESCLSMIPLGIVFVGPTAAEGWADEIILVNAKTYATAIDTPIQEAKHALVEQCYQWADDRIGELTAN